MPHSSVAQLGCEPSVDLSDSNVTVSLVDEVDSTALAPAPSWEVSTVGVKLINFLHSHSGRD